MIYQWRLHNNLVKHLRKERKENLQQEFPVEEGEEGKEQQQQEQKQK